MPFTLAPQTFYPAPPPVFIGGAQPYAPRLGVAALPPAVPAAVFTDRRGVVSGEVDAAIADPNPGLGIKAPVRAATTGANIALSGLQTIDGVALAAGDRVLVKDQTDPTQNGIYVAAAAAWVRAHDASSDNWLSPGTLIEVAQGTLNAGAVLALSGPATMGVVLGTTPLLFVTAPLNPAVALPILLDGGGFPLVAPVLKVQIEVPSGLTLARWTIAADVVGSLTLDLWRAPFAGLPLSAQDSILGAGAAAPALNNAQFARSANLSGWSVNCDPGDILGVYIVAATGVRRVIASLYGTRP